MWLRCVCLMMALGLAGFWAQLFAESKVPPPPRTLRLTDAAPIKVFYMKWKTFFSPCDETVLSCYLWGTLLPYFEHGPESGILVLQGVGGVSIHVKPVRSGLYLLEQWAGEGKEASPSNPTPFRKLAEIAYGERFGLLFSRLTEPWRIWPLSEQNCRLPTLQTECLRLEIRLPTWEKIQDLLLDHIDGVMIPRLLIKYRRGYLLSHDIDQELEVYNQAIKFSVEQSLPPVGVLRYVEGEGRLLVPSRAHR